MSAEQMIAAARRVWGTAKNPHLGLDEWYPVHPGDDDGVTTQRRAYHNDVMAVCVYAIAVASKTVHPSHLWNGSKIMDQCIRCGCYRKSESGSDYLPCDPSKLANAVEPCCECGADYPASDLIAGHIYCTACRVDRCAAKLWNVGKASPRTCEVCELGPCLFGETKRSDPTT